jgi:hypothetical protein
MIIPLFPPLEKGSCEKIGTAGRVGISSKFYNCGCFEGRGNKALQVATIIEVFHRGGNAKMYRCKTFPISLPALST